MAGVWKYMEGWRRRKGGRKIGGKRVMNKAAGNEYKLEFRNTC